MRCDALLAWPRRVHRPGVRHSASVGIGIGIGIGVSNSKSHMSLHAASVHGGERIRRTVSSAQYRACVARPPFHDELSKAGSGHPQDAAGAMCDTNTYGQGRHETSTEASYARRDGPIPGMAAQALVATALPKRARPPAPSLGRRGWTLADDGGRRC
jgi:hypothetical protein